MFRGTHHILISGVNGVRSQDVLASPVLLKMSFLPSTLYKFNNKLIEFDYCISELAIDPPELERVQTDNELAFFVDQCLPLSQYSDQSFSFNFWASYGCF